MIKEMSFDFDIVIFLFLDGDVPLSTSYGVYISQLIRFARVSSHVDDFNIVIRYRQQNFSGKDIDIIKFVRRFQNFIGGILGWSGGAMVLGKLSEPGRPTLWITVGQGPIALAVGAGGVSFGHFYFPLSFLSSFSLSL